MESKEGHCIRSSSFKMKPSSFADQNYIHPKLLLFSQRIVTSLVRKHLKFTYELVKVSVCQWRRLTNLFPFLRRCVANSLNKSKFVCVQHWFAVESNKTIKGFFIKEV